MKPFITSLKVLALSAALSLGISFAYAWSGPQTLPPPATNSQNVPAPINVSTAEQAKAGSLILGGLIKIGSGITVCNAATAGTLGYDATNKTLQYCDGVKIRKISFFQEVPQVEVSVTKTTVASGFPVLIAIKSNDVTTCSVSAISDPLSPFDATSKGFTTTVSMIAPGGDSSTVWGSAYPVPVLNAGVRSGVIKYQVSCANTNSAAQAILTLLVKKYEALATSGTGNWGETCVDYLTRVGVRGDKNIPPAAMIDGTLTQNKCKYEVRAVTANIFDPNWCMFCAPPANTFAYAEASRAGDSETPPRTECSILCFPDNGENMRPVINSELYTAGR